MFEELGFANVKTILNSGNVVFDAPDTETRTLAKKIKETLDLTFGFAIDIMVRSGNDIQTLVVSDPFKTIQVTPLTRIYVTFLSEAPRTTLKIPYISPEKDFRILRVTATDVCSVLTLSPKRGTSELMVIIEKEFGKKVTTRSWNTIMRINKILQGENK